jgi:hypothetical protein
LGFGNSYSGYSPYGHPSPKSFASNNPLDVHQKEIGNINNSAKTRTQPAYNSLFNSPAHHNQNSLSHPISTLGPNKSFTKAINKLESPQPCKSSLFSSYNGTNKTDQSRSRFDNGSISRHGTVPTKSSLSQCRIPKSGFNYQDYEQPTPGLAVNTHQDVMYGQPFCETDQAEIQETLIRNNSIPSPTSIDRMVRMEGDWEDAG